MMRIDGIEHERLMYEILGSVSNCNAPIIFKGALITKLVLDENHFFDISRQTVDIDANWIGEPPTMNQLVNIINHSLADISSNLYARGTREYSDKKSAGLSIVDMHSDKVVVEMDVSINRFQESKTYTYGELTIKGVLPNEILADKISVISGKKIFRRTKDLVDIYALGHCVEIKTSEIYASHQRNGRVLGEFIEFLNRVDDLSHAYQKLRGINNKPDFNKIYQYLLQFVAPFLECSQADKIWSPQNTVWTDESQEFRE